MNKNNRVVQNKKIMGDITDDLLTAIISLKNDPRFIKIYEWLESSKNKAGDAYIWTATEPDRTIIQGRVQSITVILKVFDEALDKMQEFRSNQQKG